MNLFDCHSSMKKFALNHKTQKPEKCIQELGGQKSDLDEKKIAQGPIIVQINK